ncbi:MAG: hypothetical protein RMJ19_09560 [Gemmatales bacterium]|nr:hypothetical protein [Gemmatales bacterium]MCS7160705.1 hypothetical protein [Gemmatales bacterium]MDW8175906.1 hypothetical protein [Gemmatales bacterium]MDW8221423.1 hypothetical protein [Gemmatales bacterium]
MPRDCPCLPQVLAMIICDMVLDDRISNKKSLIGIFDAIGATNLPCVINELHVYVTMTDGYGRKQVTVRCVKAADNEVLFGTTQRIEFPDPLAVVELNVGFCGCEFPEAGEYRFQLLVNDHVLAERKFQVTLLEEALVEEEVD